jgi:hypothetical protein
VATGWLLNLLPAYPPLKQVVTWSQVTEQRIWLTLDSFITGITCRAWSLLRPFSTLLTIRVTCDLSLSKYYHDKIYKRKMLSTRLVVAKDVRVKTGRAIRTHNREQAVIKKCSLVAVLYEVKRTP